MANRARQDVINGVSVRALVAVSKNHTFYCNNNNCPARMYLCREGTNSPYFASYSRATHIYDFCLDDSLTFRPDRINEQQFDLNQAIQAICALPDNDIHNRNAVRGQGQVGAGREIGIRTAKSLYAMCEYVGVGGLYNNVRIDDIYLCQENRANYQNALIGFCIVKASYKKKVSNSAIFEFEFAYNNNDHLMLAVNFGTEDKAWSFYNRIKKRQNFKDLEYVIAGIWTPVDNGTCDYECNIRKQSQLFFVAG